jgi:uncharacterized protein
MEVRNNESRSRYELVDDDRVVGVADYDLRDEVVVFPHTVTDPGLRGRGLGAVLVRAALDDVRRTGRRVVPACWYVREFIERNPDYADLLAA